MIEIVIDKDKLRAKCTEVSSEEEIKEVAEKLTCYLTDNTEKALALAAPQIGYNKRIFAMRMNSDMPGNLKDKPIMIMINPEIKKMSGKKVLYKEGCLSEPDYNAVIERDKQIKVKFTDMTGRIQKMTLKFMDAIAFQHEYDHLDGILMVDRAKKLINIDREPLEQAESEQTKIEKIVN